MKKEKTERKNKIKQDEKHKGQCGEYFLIGRGC